jgi:GTPase SAR1 family protein
VLLVYDITNEESFQSIQNFWVSEVESYADPEAVLMLIGTLRLI